MRRNNMTYIDFYKKYKDYRFINREDFKQVWSDCLKGIFKKSELEEITNWWDKNINKLN